MTSSLNRRGHARLLRRPRGLSIIEILVVLAIFAGLIGIGAGMIGLIGQGGARKEAVKLTSAVRYMYSQAAVNNSQYRLVLDLDTGEYYGEVVEYANVEQEEDSAVADAFLTKEAQALGKKERERRSLFSKKEADPFGIDRRVRASRIEDGLMRPGKLPEGLFFSRVIVAAEDPITQGIATVNFYPNGYQDPAIIFIEDNDGQIFSLRTEPLTGRVILEDGEMRIPDGFVGDEEE
jgi:prepilin-type N-terminal cleavage/methylation domain-containing protein